MKSFIAMALALAAAPALAQEAPKQTPPYSPEITQTEDQTPPPNVKVNVQTPTPAPTVNVQTPAQAPTVNVQPTPAPSTVVVPPPAPAAQPVVVDQRPVNVTVVQPRREVGMAVSLGGGVGQFTDSAIRDRTSPNGEYEARLLFGTHSPFAGEAAYVGTAGTIDALGVNDSAVLLSNGVEGLGRINLMDAPVQPFIVGGASWVRYNVVNRKVTMSDVRSQDDILAIPVGAGVATYLPDTGFMADIRFMYRFAFDDELLRPTPASSTGASLSNWNVSLRLGYAF